MKLYLSESGNDSNVGTISAPFKTLSKLSTVIRAGDEVYLKSGEIFYGSFPAKNATESNPIIVGSYGYGKKPLISGYKKVLSWSFHATNIWKVDLTNIANVSGNTFDVITNTGHLLVNGKEIKGDKKFSIGALTTNWEFYNDSQFLYLYLSTTPSEFTIEVACRKNLVPLLSGNQLYGIDLTGTGAHGLSAGQTTDGVIVSGCDIYNIGGSLLEGFGNGMVRYGNGVQFFDGGKNALIENCKISNCYDVAFTLQGQGTGWQNIVFRNNEGRGNCQSVEFWVKGGITGFQKIRVYNNKFYGSGYGWGYDVRPDKDVSTHIVTYDWSINGDEDIIIENNLFYKSKKGLIYHNPGQEPGVGFVRRNNHIFLDEGQCISASENTWKVEDYANYVSTKSKEEGSNFYNLRTTKNPEDALKIVLDKVSASVSNLAIPSTLQNAIPESVCRLKAVGESLYFDYETNVSMGSTDSFAPLCTLEIEENNCRADLLISFAMVGINAIPRYDVGQLSLRVVPFSGLGGATVSVLINERMGPRMGYNIPSSAFMAVIEEATGAKVKVSLYYNLSVEPYTRLVFKPILFYTDVTRQEDIVTFYDKAPAVSSLSGTIRRSSVFDPSLFFSQFSTETSGTDNYLKLAQFEIYATNTKAEAVIGYMLADDGVSPRGGIGEISVQIVPNGGLTDAACDLSIIEKSAFRYNFSFDDFKLIKEIANGTKVTCSLWFNIGKKQYARIQTKKLHFYSRDPSTVFTMFEDIAPVLSLPPGTTIAATKTGDYLKGSKIFDIPSIAAGQSTTTTVTCTGVVVGMFASAKFSLVTGLMISAEVTATNTVTVLFFNPTASSIDIGSGTLTVKCKTE